AQKAGNVSRPPPSLPCGPGISEVSGSDAKSGSLQVFGRALARTLVLHDLVGNLLAIGQATHAGTLNGRNMDENVRAAVIGLNEAKTLGAVEPLHGTCFHDDFLSIVGESNR